jgi:hypothetical protein
MHDEPGIAAAELLLVLSVELQPDPDDSIHVCVVDYDVS